MEKIHVLLVEDELTLAMIIKDTLEEQRFIITTASDGEEGLRTFFTETGYRSGRCNDAPWRGFRMVRHIGELERNWPLYCSSRHARPSMM